jgi:hypothetical protein
VVGEHLVIRDNSLDRSVGHWNSPAKLYHSPGCNATRSSGAASDCGSVAFETS